ncbi:MAG: AraC family transcriptional regulator ligand-binding domain-containing protein [Porticoccaceae bacterium]|nr:AraC family transcriptional regulator ligand-binding domain-containing protein [Porticoccaceae bacterium]MDG1473364.1 AraC family transcriptional regulator ligand-binding domain-containing protein [Porticoccaceae bacterium]
MFQHVINELNSLITQYSQAEGFLERRGDNTLDLINSELATIEFLSASQADQICDQAIQATGEKSLGLKLGVRLDMLSAGIFGYALMSCATVGKTLHLLRRYNQAVLPSMTIDLIQEGTSVLLSVRATHLPKQLQRFYTDTLFSALFVHIRLLTGNNQLSAKIYLKHAPVSDADLYQSIFGDQIYFGAERDAIIFENKTVDYPLLESNSEVGLIFQRECDRIVAADQHLGLISQRVKQILVSSRLRFPTCAEMAAEIHMSESTLQRRLKKENTRYQELLDQVRYRLALEYFKGTQLPVVDVADLLGFSSATNFRRTFKRWSGVTPAAIRKIS